MQKINPQLDVSCPLCLQEREIMDHLLRSCEFSRKIWQEINNSLKHPGLTVDTIEVWARGWFQNFGLSEKAAWFWKKRFMLLFGRFGRNKIAGFSMECKKTGRIPTRFFITRFLYLSGLAVGQRPWGCNLVFFFFVFFFFLCGIPCKYTSE